MMDAGGRPATGRGCVQLVLGPMFRCVCRLRRTKTKKDAPVAASLPRLAHGKAPGFLSIACAGAVGH